METDISRKGSMRRPLIMFLGLLAIAVVAGRMWARHGGVDESTKDEGQRVSVHETKDPVTGDRRYALSIPTDTQEVEGSGDPWKGLQEAFKVERINPSEDPKQRARAAAKSDFSLLNQSVKELEAEGLEGDELYAALEARLMEENAEGALQLLEGYRRLEGELANAGLDGMNPEERFEVVVKARRDAFGEETAEHLFFEKEAYTRYKLEEKAIAQDTGLTEAEKEAEIIGRRNALQVELASRGSYVSFADERRRDLDRRLGERYGERVGAMSEEERRAAVLEMAREDLPPETVEKAERILSAQAEKRAVFEAYRSESEEILKDTDLSFEEKQERLADLAVQYDASPSGAGL
jgi:lipase chaperone LimK